MSDEARIGGESPLAERLRLAMHEKYGKGARPQILIDKLGIKQGTVSKIWRGDTRRSTYTPLIAEFLGINPLWLAEGRGPMKREPQGSGGGLEDIDKSSFRRYPLISKVPAGSPDEPFDPYSPGMAEDWIPSPVPCSDSSYALRVHGSSMDDRTADAYPNGSVIFCDPTLAHGATVGHDVIAEVIEDSEVSRTFKRLDVNESGRPILRPLNTSYKVIELEFSVIALVISVSIDKRRK